MLDLHAHFVGRARGFFSALLFSSIPVGPINLTILNEGAQRGFLWAHAHRPRRVGDGGRFTAPFPSPAFPRSSTPASCKSLMEVFSFVFLIFLGGKFLHGQNRERADQARRRLGKNRGAAGSKTASALGLHDRLCARDGQPRRVAVLARAVAANFMSHDWVDADSLRRQGRVHRRRARWARTSGLWS